MLEFPEVEGFVFLFRTEERFGLVFVQLPWVTQRLHKSELSAMQT